MESFRVFMKAAFIFVLLSSSYSLAEGGDLFLSGDTDVYGDINITKTDKGIKYPNGTRQTGWYARTIIVSPLGNDSENGDRLTAVMNGITGVDSSKPFLIKLEPGIYDIGSNTLTVKPWVHLEGSGQEITFIRGNPPSSLQGSPNGVVACGDYTGLRWLTVENYGSAELSMAVSLYDATNVTLNEITVKSSSSQKSVIAIYMKNSGADLFRVTAEAAGGGPLSAALYSLSTGFSAYLCRFGGYQAQGTTGDSYGVYTDTAAMLTNCTIGAGEGGNDSFGIFNSTGFVSMEGGSLSGKNGSRWNHGIQSSGTFQMRGVEVGAEGGNESFGLHNVSTASTGYFENGRIWATTKAVRNDNDKATVYVAGSRLYNGVSNYVKCAGVYDASYTFYANACP